MKTTIKITLSLFAVFVCTIIAYLGYTAFTITDPYVVNPTSTEPAKKGARVGYSFDKDSKSLSVVSSKDVTVVADPGKSFKYVEIWIVERPKASSDLFEYKFHVSKFAQSDKMHFSSTTLPDEVMKASKKKPMEL